MIVVIASCKLQAQTAPAAANQRLAWWRDAHFGMFIHWGLYAIPAGEWKGQQIPGIGEWIMNRAKIPVREYEQLAKQFNPVKFNADEWVRVAKEAGQKYMVITAKHHDGFAMFHSRVSKYNIYDATPFHRDPIAELAAACKRQGMRLGFYYSQTQDWHDPNGNGNNWDYDESKKDFNKYLHELAIPQVRELLTQYGPVALIWFDTPRIITEQQSKELVDLVHKLQPNCLVDGRVGHDVGDYRSMGDNQIPVKLLDYDWETPVTLNDTWGFKKNDNNWKSPQTLIRQLVDVVSKNGNYLLNVGPTPEGVIPQPSVDRLMAVGKWLRTNGDAVYGAKASPFPYEQEWGSITLKPGKLFMNVTEWPKSEFVLYGLKSKVKGARLLANPGQPLRVSQSYDQQKDLYSVRIALPGAAPDPDVSVIALDIDGTADVQAGLMQQPDGTVTLSPAFAQVHDASKKLTIDNRGITTDWMDPKASLSWDFRMYRPGSYSIVLVTTETRAAAGGDSWEGGHAVSVAVAGQRVQTTVTNAEPGKDPRNPRWRDYVNAAGRVQIKDAGVLHLVVQPKKIETAKGMGLTLRQVRLVPSP
jgi:alpha-L-fucosidase